MKNIITIREQTENIEEQILSSYASKSRQTKGRRKKEGKCEIRTEYQRDRDRILHCNSFKRLKHKTQVFLSPKSDHYRTRLVHTLEVAQIARTVARGLKLNEDLTEAIALGHDLGHPPFGHAGEKVLNNICPFEFTHAQNSVRMAEYLERNGKGLNLTYETIDGIAKHSKLKAQTQEGQIVKICDKVAYVNHDIEDSIRASILKLSDLPTESIEVLGKTKSQRISTIVKSLIENSDKEIKMDKIVEKAHENLRSYMFENVYFSVSKQEEIKKAENIIEVIFDYYCKNQDKMPKFYREISIEQGKERGVCDYISGMTDNYVIEKYKDLFIPKQWSI